MGYFAVYNCQNFVENYRAESNRVSKRQILSTSMRSSVKSELHFRKQQITMIELQFGVNTDSGSHSQRIMLVLITIGSEQHRHSSKEH